MKPEKLSEKLNELEEENNRLKAEVEVLAKKNNKLAESEKKSKEIFNSTNDAIFIHDAETGSLIDVNNPMLEMYGYEQNDIPNLSMKEVFGEDEPFTFENAKVKIAKAISEGPQVFDWIAKRKNGTKFWVAVSLRCCKIGEDNIVIAEVRNIDERKK